jgi:ribonuclease HI
MATSKKYYVVWIGARPGIYAKWGDCEAQIKGFPGARYQGFPSREAAEAAYAAGPPAVRRRPSKKTAPARPSPRDASHPHSLCVDAACSGNPGALEYQGVLTQSGERIFHQQFPLGTNNIGEFLGIVHALALLKQKGKPDMPIYSDSQNAIKWVQQKKCKTTLDEGPKTKELFEVIRRAEKWLQENQWRNPLLKWDTEHWGEIPADFGRK